MKPIKCDRRIEWDSAHRVTRHESKCRTLHGHRYVAIVECESEALDHAGRVVDFGVMKERVGAWVDEHLDHTTICASWDHDLIAFCRAEALAKGHKAPYVTEGEPTAENIAALILTVSQGLLDGSGVRVLSVRVFETPNCSATAEVSS